ncbi:MAG: DUF4411 family protein [Chromatiaceae bacterium]|nr:DUF4411 family protein [Chromatiaceae bacterium]
MDDDTKYSIDTSALLHGWVRAYPPSIFPALWDRLEELISNGQLIASKEVLNELKRKDDDLFEWCSNREEMFVEIDDNIQVHMAHIMGKYQKLVDTSKGKSGADPFVIALAMTHNPPFAVVSEEKGGSAKNPKIPYVCREEDILCITLLQLIQKQGWKF